MFLNNKTVFFKDSMNKIVKELRALHESKGGQASAVGVIVALLVVLIFIAVVTLVIGNILTIAGLDTGLWTLYDLLLSVGFIVVLVSFIGIAGTLFLMGR
jgi:uncharacterized BrkB/YihY/UPF0761 family membrane protein